MRSLSGALKLAFKLALVAVLFYFLAKKGFLSLEATRKAFSHPKLIACAMALIIGTNLLGVVRWQILLRAQEFRLPWLRTFQLTFIGIFFNLALPGAVSGDLVKAWYVAKETDGQRGRVFGTILFDRVAGVSALVLVAAGALMMRYRAFFGTAFLLAIGVLLKTAATCVILFYGYLFLVRESHDPLLKLLGVLEGKAPKLASITRIYLGLRHYHHHRRVVLQALAISIVIQVSMGASAILFAHALGDVSIPSLPVFVAVPLGLLVTAVPLTPAGVGTGHAAFGWLFQYLGSHRGADVFSLIILTQLIGGAIGGFFYLRFRSKESPPVSEPVAPEPSSAGA